MPSIVEDVFKI